MTQQLSIPPVATVIVALGLSLIGCEINYEEGELLEELSEKTPLLQFIEADYSYKRTRERLISISARKAESFEQLAYLRFEEVAFIESDQEGNILNSGSAESAIYYFNNNIELEGNVIFQSYEHNAIIRAPYLLWDDVNQLITGRENDRVEVTRESGTHIVGQGVEADLQTRRITLKKTEGIIYPEPEERAVGTISNEE